MLRNPCGKRHHEDDSGETDPGVAVGHDVFNGMGIIVFRGLLK